MTIVTRFPPSPTGLMHIGTARTALFNWLFARKHGGKMLFRIEDTDRARHSEDAVTALINAMKWLELDWDGDIVSQYEQRDRHAQIAQQLLDEGKAWKCYFTAEELEKIRKDNGGFKLPRRAELEDTSKFKPSQTDTYTIRIEAPTQGTSTIKDHVQGTVSVENTELDDFVLLRSDGSPTYMLSVVVDDHDMGVNHVIRGDDHLNNTFRQNILYNTLGWKQPEYAHLPLILGPDGTKMSKRHGAASVEDYREMGYLPEAVRNYLLRLGWSHGDDELITTQQALEWFNLEACNKAAARFDFDKLESINAHYIKESDTNDLLTRALPFYQKRHNIEPDEQAQKRIIAHSDELKSRAKTLLQFVDESAFYAKTPPLGYDEKAASLLDQDVLNALLNAFDELSTWTDETIQNACKAVADQLKEGKLGKIAMPLRAALTGTTVSPSVFKAAEILGKDETRTRMCAAIEFTQN